MDLREGGKFQHFATLPKDNSVQHLRTGAILRIPLTAHILSNIHIPRMETAMNSDRPGDMTTMYSVHKIENHFPRNTNRAKEDRERGPGPTRGRNGCEKMRGRLLV